MSGKSGMRNSGGGIAARGGAAARSAAGTTQRVKFEAIAINSVAKKKPTAEDAAHYIGLEHIDPGCFVVSRWGGDVAPIGDKLLMKKGDVLFGRRRAYQRKVAIAPFDGIFSAHGMVLRPKTDVVDEKFFPFFIASDQFMNEAIRISVGGLSPTINWGTLKNCEFDLPPMDEQKKLAELLWAANDLKESYKKAIIATDEMLKAKFREMFGDAGDGEVFNAETQRRREVDGGSVSHGDAETRRGQINTFFLLKAGKSIRAEYLSEEPINDKTVPCYGGNGVRGYVHVHSHDGIFCLIGRQGEYSGNVQMASGKFFVTEHAIVVTPLINIEPIWLCEKLREMNLLQYSRGVAQPGLSVANLNELEIEIPPLSLQREFVAIADKAESAKANLKKSIAAIDQVMKGLINE